MFNLRQFIEMRKLEHTFNKIYRTKENISQVLELIYRDFNTGYEIIYGKKANNFWRMFTPDVRIEILSDIYKKGVYQDDILLHFGFIFQDVGKEIRYQALKKIYFEVLSEQDRNLSQNYSSYLSNLSEEDRFEEIKKNYKKIISKYPKIFDSLMFSVWHNLDNNYIFKYIELFESDESFIDNHATFIFDIVSTWMFNKKYSKDEYSYFSDALLKIIDNLDNNIISKILYTNIRGSYCLNIIKNKDKIDPLILYAIINVLKKQNDADLIDKFRREGNDLIAVADYIRGNINLEELAEKIQVEVPYPVVSKKFSEEEFEKMFAGKVIMNEHYDKTAYMNLIRYLTKTNINIFSSINMDLMNPKYLDIFEEKDELGNKVYPSLRIIGKYPKLQKIILSLDDESLSVFKLIYKRIVKDDYDYTVILTNVFNSLAKGHDKLFDIIKSEYNDLSSEDKNKVIDSLVFILSKGSSNYFGISSIRDLVDLKGYFKTKYASVKDECPSIKKLLNYYLLSYYGMTLNDARILISSFASDLDVDDNLLDENDRKIISSLKAIKSLIECKSYDILHKKLVLQESLNDGKIDYDVTYLTSFEAQIRKMYARVLNRKLSNLKNMNKYQGLSEEVGLDIYEGFNRSNPEFYLLISALGAYTNYVKPDNYYEDWVRPSNNVHAFCTSLISNQMMGTARANYAILGFTNIPESSLLISAPYDINSGQASSLIDTAVRTRRKFLFPDKTIDYTRHTHNEITLERLYKDSKYLPSYVLYFAEGFNPDTFTSDITSDETNLDAWNNALQAARDFNIPIVVVDRTKVKRHEKVVINAKLDEFKRTYNPHLIPEILTRFENNRAGVRKYWDSSLYTTTDANIIFSKIFAIIDEMKDRNRANDCLIEMRKWLRNEVTTKIARKGNAVGNVELGINCSDIFEKIKKRLVKLNKQSMTWKDAIDILENVDLQNLSALEKIKLLREYGFNIEADKFTYGESSQKGLFYLEDILSNFEELLPTFNDDIDRQKAYSLSLETHGKNHIDDVMLYALLLSVEAFKDRSDFISLVNMAVTAAKYHDCGRSDDGNSHHAIEGAIKSYHILKNKRIYNKAELAAIYTAIVCHDLKGIDESYETYCAKLYPDVLMAIIKGKEPNVKVSYTEDDLNRVVKVNNVNFNSLIDLTRRLCSIVRESDALDRTRFLKSTKSFTRESSLLPDSKRYMNLALRISELNALGNIQELINTGMIDINEVIDILDSPRKYDDFNISLDGPKELSRIIRRVLLERKSMMEKGTYYGSK